MWLITGLWRAPNNTGDQEFATRMLKPGKLYRLGRSNQLLLGAAHKHISALHTTLEVGPHSVQAAADINSRPSLTILPQGPRTDNGKTKRFQLMINRAGSPQEVLTHDHDDVAPPVPFALQDGDRIIMRGEVADDEEPYKIEWRPVVFDVEGKELSFNSVAKKMAPLGIKVVRKNAEALNSVTHFVTEKELNNLHKSYPLNALARGTPFVTSAFVDTLESAAKETLVATKDTDKWSELELDVNRAWPMVGDFAPKVVLKDEVAKGPVAFEDKKSILGGLTILAIGKETDPNMQVVKIAVERYGGTFVSYFPAAKTADLRKEVFEVIRKNKEAADKAYPNYLRQVDQSMPAQAQGSGLLYILVGNSQALFDLDIDLDDFQPAGERLGLSLLTLPPLVRALYEGNVLPLFKEGRKSGASCVGVSSLPSQVSASISSSRGQSVPLELPVSPDVDMDAPLPAVDSPIKSPRKMVDDTTFDVGDDDFELDDLPNFDLDQFNKESTPPPAPRSTPTVAPAPTRTATNAFDYYDLPPSRPAKTRATAHVEAEASASMEDVAESFSGRNTQSYAEMSFNAPLPQSDKARSLFQSLRAKSRGDPASLPASTRGSQAPGQGGIEVEDDFVEVQRKRRRAEEATREEVQRKKVRLEEVLGESQEAEGRTDRLGLKAPSSQAEDPESSRAAFARGGEMPPPPVPDKNKNKRKAVDTEESDTNFLRAPVKRKKKGEAEDPLDVDFNNLRIAKNVAFSATTPDIPVVDGVIPRIIPQYVAVKRRERPAQPSNHPENGPNFKKFHSNKDPNKVREARTRAPLQTRGDDESNIKPRSRLAGNKLELQDVDMKPFDQEASAASQQGSSSKTQSGPRSQTQSSSTAAGSATQTRRKRLIIADDSDDEQPVASTNKTLTRKRAGARAGSGGGGAGGRATRATPRTTATLEESDEEDEPPRAKVTARTAGRKKLVQADDSDDDGFKGFGTGTRSRRR